MSAPNRSTDPATGLLDLPEMANTAAPPPTASQALPDDILFAILPFLARQDLCAMALVKKGMNEIGRPHLFREVVLGSVDAEAAATPVVEEEGIDHATDGAATTDGAAGAAEPTTQHAGPPTPHPAATLLAASPTLRAAVHTLRLREHLASACPAHGDAVHLPNLEVLDITLTDQRSNPDWHAPPMCVEWPGRMCPIAEAQTPRTIVVRAEKWVASEVWAARERIFSAGMLERLETLVVVTEMGSQSALMHTPRPPYAPVELVQISTHVPRLHEWFASAPPSISLTVVGGEGSFSVPRVDGTRTNGSPIRTVTLDEYVGENEGLLEDKHVRRLRELKVERDELEREKAERAKKRLEKYRVYGMGPEWVRVA